MPSLPMILAHHFLKYVTGLVILRSTSGGSVSAGIRSSVELFSVDVK